MSSRPRGLETKETVVAEGNTDGEVSRDRKV